MGSMIKVDLQNRAYVAQKAVASGFQAVNFADHPHRPGGGGDGGYDPAHGGRTSGLYGCPTRRFISSPAGVTQQEHIQRLNDIVLCFMIEKQEAVENVEEICSVPGVDMVQFGPSDYCMSRGWNRSDHAEDYKAAERRVIEAALRHGVQPRCEINAPEEAQYYIDLGVRHFSLGDQMAVLKSFWTNQGGNHAAHCPCAGGLNPPLPCKKTRKNKSFFRVLGNFVWLLCDSQPPDNKFVAAHAELFALGGAARGGSDQRLEISRAISSRSFSPSMTAPALRSMSSSCRR